MNAGSIKVQKEILFNAAWWIYGFFQEWNCELNLTQSINITVYFIFLFIFQIITNKKANELLKQIEGVKKEKEELKEEANSIKNRICSFQKEYTLRNLFLKKQIRDYEKELSFWRNVVSQVLYTGDKKHTQAEILFDSVTKQLESYTVKSKQNLDLDEILFVAKEINNDEKK